MNMKKVERVTVVGSGMMGSGIGAMAALAGKRTVLVDVDEARVNAGKEKAFACIDLRVENGLNTVEEAASAKALLSVSTDLGQGVKDADMVVEAIIEKVEAKQALFKTLDAILPLSVPICSNTSGLRITDISLLCAHPERTFTTHFWLPAHLVPLVEVVMGDKSDHEMGHAVVEELKTWKKSPVFVARDLPGQLANRIFQAIIRESIDIVESGLASAEDVDTAIGCGMAMRFPVWGPLTHLDAIGLNLGLSVQDSVLPSICASDKGGDYIRSLVAEGNLGAPTGKGFYDWKNDRDISEAIRKRDAFIIEAVKIREKIEGNK